ncbi:MAG: SMP-30/gluconolactonase/LRE family protein, partial [Acidobacteria bacterium]|nr:SMP-30/gluconolactonase/LRE family protein [Bryobacteraceae bacterium CoA2 C42]
MTARFFAQEFYAPADERLRYLPEGPRLLAGGRELGWVAIQHSAEAATGSLNRLEFGSRENRSLALPGRPGFFAETARPGRWLVGMERRLVL